MGGALGDARARARDGDGGLLRRDHRHGRDARAARRAGRAVRLARPRRGAAELPRPAPGTPFADLEPVPALDALRTIAAFRLALPRTILRFAGGRELTLGDLGARQGMVGGINAVIVGNYLTTLGPRSAGGPRPAGRAEHAGEGAEQDAVTGYCAGLREGGATATTAVACVRSTRRASAPPAAASSRSRCCRPATRPNASAARHRPRAAPHPAHDRERAGADGDARRPRGAPAVLERLPRAGRRSTVAEAAAEAARDWGAGAGASQLVSGHMAHHPSSKRGSPSSRAPRRACCSAPATSPTRA